jgi:hypothetical protein
MHPSTCRASGAEPTDPTRVSYTRKRFWQEEGTHKNTRLMSAESELGKLPVSLLLLSSLHTEADSARSAVLRRTHSNDVPLQYPRTVPVGGLPLENSLVTSRARGPILRVPQQPCSPRSMPPTCIPRHAVRSEQSRPIRPTSAARANAIGNAQ